MGLVPWCVFSCLVPFLNEPTDVDGTGQDNPSTQCIVGDVPYIWDGNLDDHDGPYNGVEMGC